MDHPRAPGLRARAARAGRTGARPPGRVARRRSTGGCSSANYSQPADGLVHQPTVAIYAVQRPGIQEQRSFGSAAPHLIALCLVLERGPSAQQTTTLLAGIIERPAAFRRLGPPRPNGTMNVSDVVRAARPAGRVLGTRHLVLVGAPLHGGPALDRRQPGRRPAGRMTRGHGPLSEIAPDCLLAPARARARAH